MGGLFGQQGKSTSTVDKMAAGIRFQTSAFGLAWTLLFGRNRITGNLVDYQDFIAIPHTESQDQAQGGKGGSAPSSTHTSFTYQVALAIGLCAGPVAEDAIKTIWIGKEKKYGSNAQIGSSSPRVLGWSDFTNPILPSPSPSLFELMTGEAPQEPWSYMVTHHPERALGYHGLVCAVAPKFDLGDNENLANIGLELVGLLPYDQPADVDDYEMTLPSDTEVMEQIVVASALFTVAHGAAWTRDVSVIDNTTDPENPVTFFKVPSSPGLLQYSVTDEGEYEVNIGEIGKTLDITYGYQSNSMTITVPEYLHFIANLGVKDAGGSAMPEIGSGTPAINEYSEDGTGEYTFSRFNSGDLVKVSYSFNEQLGAVADDILKYTWNNALCGLGQSLNKLEDWSDWRNFVLANNWLLSPFLTAQESAKDFWERVLEMTNSYPVWRAGKIGIIPRGDVQVIGNSTIWMPDMTSLFSLGPLHFLVEEGSLPVRWRTASGDTASSAQDAYNHVQVEFLNKDSEYNTETAEYKDEADIEDNGLKTDPTVYKYHEITFKEFAQQVAQNKVNDRLFQADQFEYDLSWHFGRYWPGDIVDLTDLGLSLESQLVRIIKRVESQEGCYTFTVQSLDIGSGTPGVHEVPQGQGYAPDYGAEPGDVNVPVIFVPPANLLTTEMEVWAAVSGGVNWGGCNVWISESGENYRFAGQIIGGARHGVLLADLPASAVSPDTVNTLSADLSTSRGSMLSGLQADAEALNTLCRVEGGGSIEYLAYKTATLVSQYIYDLTWLVRGVYGSGMLLRPSGSTFVRLDGAVFKYLCKRVDIGKTIYIKFQSFNIYQRKLQGLEDIDPYTFTVTNPGDQGMNPVLGLTAANNAALPNTKIDIAFNSCPMYNTAGSSYESGALGFTINSGVIGLNGKDVAGALAPNSIYFYHAVVNVVSQIVGGLLSSSSSSPTLPSGFTHKRLLGPVYTDGSGNLVGFNQVGNEWLYDDVQLQDDGLSWPPDWTDQDCSGLIPPISTRGKFSLQVSNQEVSASAAFGLRRNGSSAVLGQLQGQCLPGADARADGWCDTDVSQVVELKAEDGLDWMLYVIGFYLNI